MPYKYSQLINNYLINTKMIQHIDASSATQKLQDMLLSMTTGHLIHLYR